MVGLARMSLVRPSAVRNNDTPAPSGKSARIVALPAPDRALTCDDAALIASRMIAAAFPGRSENDTCDRAALTLGVNASTVRRILRRETHEPSARIVLTCMSVMAAQGRDPLAVLGPHLPALQRALAQPNPGRSGDETGASSLSTAAPVSLPGRAFRRQP